MNFDFQLDGEAHQTADLLLPAGSFVRVVFDPRLPFFASFQLLDVGGPEEEPVTLDVNDTAGGFPSDRTLRLEINGQPYLGSSPRFAIGSLFVFGGASSGGGETIDASARSSAQQANDAIAVLDATYSTDAEREAETAAREAAVATLQGLIGDKVDQSVYDAAQSLNSTDQERTDAIAALVAARDVIDAEQDAEIAANMTSIQDETVRALAAEGVLSGRVDAADQKNAAQDLRLDALEGEGDELLTVDNDGDALDPGSYRLDSQGGSFSVTLNYVNPGDWFFRDTGPAGDNTVTIGASGDSFLVDGVVESGPREISDPLARYEVSALAGADEYQFGRVLDFTPPQEMVGATATEDGDGGLAPAPVAGSDKRVLHSDGTWREIDKPERVHASLSALQAILDADAAETTPVFTDVTADEPTDELIEAFALAGEHKGVTVFFTGDDDPESDEADFWLIDGAGRATPSPEEGTEADVRVFGTPNVVGTSAITADVNNGDGTRTISTSFLNKRRVVDVGIFQVVQDVTIENPSGLSFIGGHVQVLIESHGVEGEPDHKITFGDRFVNEAGTPLGTVLLPQDTIKIFTFQTEIPSGGGTQEPVMREFTQPVGGAGTLNEMSRLVGNFQYSTTAGRDEAQDLANGILWVYARTIVNGAITYPVWASRHPEFIVGNDIVIPANVEGMFLRNLGGNAGSEGAFQDDATDVNGLQIGYNDEDSEAQGFSATGNNAVWGTDRELINTSGPFNSSDPETRPFNRAYQLVTFVDTFQVRHEVGSLPSEGLVHTKLSRNTTTDISTGAPIVWEKVNHLGAVSIVVNSDGTLTLPQSDQPYVTEGDVHTDFDGEFDFTVELGWRDDSDAASSLEDVTAFGSTFDRDISSTVEIAAWQSYPNRARAIWDAKDGPITVDMRALSGSSSNYSYFRVTASVYQVPRHSVIMPDALATAPIAELEGQLLTVTDGVLVPAPDFRPKLVAHIEGVIIDHTTTNADDDLEYLLLDDLQSSSAAGFEVDTDNEFLDTGVSINDNGGLTLPSGFYAVKLDLDHPTASIGGGTVEGVGSFQSAIVKAPGTVTDADFTVLEVNQHFGHEVSPSRTGVTESSKTNAMVSISDPDEELIFVAFRSANNDAGQEDIVVRSLKVYRLFGL